MENMFYTLFIDFTSSVNVFLCIRRDSAINDDEDKMIKGRGEAATEDGNFQLLAD